MPEKKTLNEDLFYKGSSANLPRLHTCENKTPFWNKSKVFASQCEKRDKYLDLARELKKLWNMKVTIIPIVIGAFGTVTKGLLKGLEDLEVGGRVETIQTKALLKTTRILRRVLET